MKRSANRLPAPIELEPFENAMRYAPLHCLCCATVLEAYDFVLEAAAGEMFVIRTVLMKILKPRLGRNASALMLAHFVRLGLMGVKGDIYCLITDDDPPTPMARPITDEFTFVTMKAAKHDGSGLTCILG